MMPKFLDASTAGITGAVSSAGVSSTALGAVVASIAEFSLRFRSLGVRRGGFGCGFAAG